ncbi:MAG: cytochrome bc complex cytochrome b subunit, partial [Halobacteria archaeon]|nr:cytochrome bc complex cytochrome b subunit [Halobacteria archaeon]
FLLGEIALFCFVVLILTGTFLGFFFEPSTSKVEYQGSVAKFQGQELPESFVSVLQITYDVPYGMLLRRMHHWAAHLFVASIALHMLRVFFTGAYRNPREPNWVVGTALVVLAMVAGYTGYALPFDEFASTATGIGFNVASSIPVVGGLIAKIFFGGEFPSSETIPRLYFLHVMVLPIVISVLIGVHMAILMRQKHTEAPRSGSEYEGDDAERNPHKPAPDDDSVIVGLPAFPNQTAVSFVVFFLTLATLSLLAGFLPVHNIAEYGPNNPAGTPELVMPDWYFMWFYGILKLLPSWMSFTIPLVGTHISTEFIGGVVIPGAIFAVVVAWPFIDYYREPEHFTINPLDRPHQTSVGIAGVVFIMLASIAGMNNILAKVLGVGTGVVNLLLTFVVVVGPVAAGLAVFRLLGGDTDELVSDIKRVSGRVRGWLR